jgi:hypothetical protein
MMASSLDAMFVFVFLFQTEIFLHHQCPIDLHTSRQLATVGEKTKKIVRHKAKIGRRRRRHTRKKRSRRSRNRKEHPRNIMTVRCVCDDQ